MHIIIFLTNHHHSQIANRLRCRWAMSARQARLAAYSKSKAPSIPIETGHHFRVDTAIGSGRCPPIRWLVWGGLRYRLEQNARALPSDRQVDDRNRPLGSEACKPAPDPMLSHGAGHRMTAVRLKEPVATAGFPAAWFDEPWSLSAAVRVGRQTTHRVSLSRDRRVSAMRRITIVRQTDLIGKTRPLAAKA